MASIAYGNNNYVIVKRDGKILTSSDGHEWKEKYFLQGGSFTSVTYNGNMFVAAGAYTVALPYGGPLTYGKCVIMTSPDGNNWQLQDAGYNADLKGITWSGKKFAVAGTNIILSSENGITWNAVEVNAILHDIAFGNGIFAAVGYDGVIMSSVDGEHWETKVEALRYDLTNIVWYDNKFIAIGSGSTPSIVVSGDGKTRVARGPKDASYKCDSSLHNVEWRKTGCSRLRQYYSDRRAKGYS
ncbi:MAG TPA: hypothetical protein DEF39_03510 [Hungateiclostridium thermocellum]|uniref:WD40/YVTN/BNR-like repeat-containing protein n=1 Tax=Acetivibrio thermocellus TaxID=1515 RepID=UPI000038FAD3|nr:hypothetical protein [Acetivibrio thermocellus]HBW26337.1 hypothetical protein [Acetivibrio thermocellus]